MAEIIIEQEFRIELPGGLNIYRLRRPEVSEEIVRQVGTRFGLSGTVEAGTFTLNARSISYTERSAWGLQLFRRSGGWQYRDATRWQVDAGQESPRISAEEAARLALDAIARSDVAERSELALARVRFLHAAQAERGGANHSERIIGARVEFRRTLDSLFAVGPGGKTVVYLDHERQLTGIDHLWREIEDVHAPVSGLRPVSEALDEVRRRYAGTDGRVEVTDLQLGYFELGWDDGQEFLQPAYVAFLQLSSPDSRFRMGAVAALPAAVNAPGPVERESRSSEPQPLRSR
ncbi:MAG: hypothetical protein ABSB76_01760 [Streptosporangiaceae bacterium]|jgi:hypothetical protein